MSEEATENSQKVQEAWDEVSNGDPVSMTIPGTFEALNIEKLTTESNRVSVWVNGSTSDEPDYVIVNPPTEVALSKTETVYDPLGAIAMSILGAQK